MQCHIIETALEVLSWQTEIKSFSTVQVKRNPFDGSSGFPSFFAAAKAPFGDSSYSAPAPASYSAPAPSYNAPAPAPAASYSAPEPSYSAPEPSYNTPAPVSYSSPSYPSPSYQHQPQPTHNCSIQEETLEAQVSPKAPKWKT